MTGGRRRCSFRLALTLAALGWRPAVAVAQSSTAPSDSGFVRWARAHAAALPATDPVADDALEPFRAIAGRARATISHVRIVPRQAYDAIVFLGGLTPARP